MANTCDRRSFLQLGAGIGAGLAGASFAAQAAAASPAAPPPVDPVRVGFVGVGHKGSNHVKHLLRMEGVELRAVCDINEEAALKAQFETEKVGKPRPTSYTRGDTDFKRMCETEDLDLVFTATPWEWHVPVCIAAMENGKHVATEVPAAIEMEQCWQLVETSEKTGRHCVMLENVNYMEPEMMILNMVRKGLLGEVLHGEAGYLHDTRQLKMNDFGDGLWLGNHHAMRNGNLYPTHGLGPMAWYMDINRGDRFDYLVSMSTKARGLDLYAEEHLPPEHPKRQRRYINGDVNASLIRTVNGRTIILKHDTDLPRPYSRTNLVQGTRGIVRGYPDLRLHLEAEHKKNHWEPGEAYLTKYEHPLWKDARARAKTMSPLNENDEYRLADELRNGEYFEDYRLVEAIRNGVQPDFDVYDAAAWSAVTELSEWSVANRSRPIDFPDFTRGKWQTNPPVSIMGV